MMKIIKTILLGSISALILTACGKHVAYETPQNPYRFSIGMVATQLAEPDAMPIRINGQSVAGGMLQRVNEGLFNNYLATLNVSLLDAQFITDKSHDEENWREKADNWVYPRELRMKVGLAAVYQNRVVLNDVYGCVVRAPQGSEQIGYILNRWRQEALADGDATLKLWNELQEECLNDIATQFLSDIAVAG